MNWLKSSFVFCLLIPASISCESQTAKTVLMDGAIREVGKSVRVIYREANKVLLVTCPFENGDVYDHVADAAIKVLSRKECNRDNAQHDERNMPRVEEMDYVAYKAKLEAAIGIHEVVNLKDVSQLEAEIASSKEKLDYLVTLSVGSDSNSERINEQLKTVGDQLQKLKVELETARAHETNSDYLETLLSYLEATNNVSFNIAETNAAQLLLPFETFKGKREIQMESETATESTPTSLINQIGMEYVIVKKGKFLMGVTGTDNGPQHEVTISKSFQMQTTEVTQAQWVQVMKSNPSVYQIKDDCPEDFKRAGGFSLCANHPVENVTWFEAKKFTDALNKLHDGYEYELPTEAQWEYAARGGIPNDNMLQVPGKVERSAWFKDNANNRTHAVGEKLANPIGLFDMHGNVLEWTDTGNYRYTKWPETDPNVPNDGLKDFMAVRGGSFASFPGHCSAATRGFVTASNRHETIGFRTIRRKK